MRLLFVLLTVGCADDQPPGVESRDLFPLRTGASWTYRVTDTATQVTESKTQTVRGPATYEGKQAMELVSELPGGKSTVSWQQDLADAVVRLAEDNYSAGSLVGGERYSPHKLRVSKTLYEPGASEVHTYSEEQLDRNHQLVVRVTKTDTWRVVGIADVVIAGGPTWSGAIELFRETRLDSSGGTRAGPGKSYWFVEGIGKVKEEGDGQREELLEYRIP